MAGRPRRAELALAAGSLTLGLLAAEGVVRLGGWADPRPTGYAPVNTGRGSKQRLNSRGFRDRERALAKSPGGRRIVCLGDSFAWGHGVELEDAWPSRLERILNRRRPEPWEVINLARPGMNTVQQAALLADLAFDYEPDLVLVGFVLNDSEDPEAAEARRAAEWARPRLPTPLDRSALLRLAHGRLWATGENHRRVSGYRSMYSPHASGWQAGREALEDMGQLCRERRVPLLVAVFPLFGNPLDDDYPFAELHEKVVAAARAAGAHALDLWPAYRGLRWEILVVDGVDDEHPNEVAHRIAAGAIRPLIEGLVPPLAAPGQEDP